MSSRSIAPKNLVPVEGHTSKNIWEAQNGLDEGKGNGTQFWAGRESLGGSGKSWEG